jgi:cytochrome c oxidase cbb3-type subunit 3
MIFRENIKQLTLAFILLVPGLCSATNQDAPILTWTYHNIIFVLGGLVIAGALLSLWSLMKAVFISKEREYMRANGIELSPILVDDTPNIFQKAYTHLAGLVPIEKEADIQLDHDYDGIKELDNSLPPWWIYGFYLSIVIAAGYMYVYHYSDIGLTQTEEYEMAMIIGDKKKARYAAEQANNIDENNLMALIDNSSLKVGKASYISNCSACHGQEGQGGIGPNLTDQYWLHGGSTADIFKTIKYGVPEKGMIAWKTQMQPATIHKIASYIETLKGTNPPNPKEKQGDLYVNKEAESNTDSASEG